MTLNYTLYNILLLSVTVTFTSVLTGYFILITVARWDNQTQELPIHL